MLILLLKGHIEAYVRDGHMVSGYESWRAPALSSMAGKKIGHLISADGDQHEIHVRAHKGGHALFANRGPHGLLRITTGLGDHHTVGSAADVLNSAGAKARWRFEPLKPAAPRKAAVSPLMLFLHPHAARA